MGQILIIEDNQTIAETLRYLLLSEGYKVSSAGNGLEALNLLAKETPSLILLDWLMPVMDGKRFIEELHRLPGGNQIPLVVFSASHDAYQLSKLIKACAYLSKPFRIEDLLDSVKRCLKNPTSNKTL